MKITFKVCCGENSQPTNRNTNNNNLPTIRPIGNKQEEATASSSVDRLTNSLDESNQSLDNSNPMQSLFKKLLPNNEQSPDNQISPSSNGQHSSQFEQTQSDKPPALQNVLNTNFNKNIFNNRINYVSSTVPSVPVSTPYWWRPHLSKLPTLKHHQSGLLPSSEIGSPSGSHNLNQFTLNSINNQQPGSSKSDVWVVVTGVCVAIVVAFLIVLALFWCTNYLFFPKNKPSTPCTLQTQTLHSPSEFNPAFAQQYTLHTQHHFGEYPMQHTIIK